MIPVETVPGVRGGENDGGDEFNSDMLLRTLINVTVYSYYNNYKKKKSHPLGRYHFKFTKRPSCKYTCFISDI
jgi:hypothetical protein